MKSFTIIITLVLLLASLASCGCSDSDTSFEGDYVLDEGNALADESDDTAKMWEAMEKEQAEKDAPLDPATYSCNLDFEWSTSKMIDFATAPSGYTYAVCTVYIENNAKQSISTYAGDWDFIANGVTYGHDSMTYADVIKHNNVDIAQWGKFETQFVYMIRNDVTSASLAYMGYRAPPMNRIHYYKTDKEIASERAQESQASLDSLLDDLVADGHDISDIRTENIEIDNEGVSATVFVTDELSELEYIFDFGLSAYNSIGKSDVYVVRVDGDEYWTPKEDVVKYKYQNPNYESRIYVYFPHGQKVTLEKLPNKID